MRVSLSVLSLCCFAATAMAQNAGEVAIMSCQNAARKEVQTLRPEADSVRFSPNPLVTARSRQETGVHGSGQYMDRTRQQWRPFIYDCGYRMRSAKTRVAIWIDSSIGTL